MNKWLMIAVLSLGFSLPVASAAMPGESPPPTTQLNIVPSATNLESKIEGWIAELAKQPGWEDWSKAERTISPLGPGTHGWIVELTLAGKAIGYMIVSATEDGDWMLGEFGKGETPIFSEKTLSSAMQWQGIASSEQSRSATRRLYYDALQAMWELTLDDGERYYLDAQTGERVPYDGKSGVRQAETPLMPALLTGPLVTADRTYFDPYEHMNWVTAQPLDIANMNDLQKAYRLYKQLVYVCDLYEEHFHVPYAVTGYRSWNDNGMYLGIALQDDNVRFIPLETALQLGAFYAN